jgi:hypothetical protein
MASVLQRENSQMMTEQRTVDRSSDKVTTRELRGNSQFGVGSSTWSITSTSTDAFSDFSSSPN